MFTNLVTFAPIGVFFTLIGSPEAAFGLKSKAPASFPDRVHELNSTFPFFLHFVTTVCNLDLCVRRITIEPKFIGFDKAVRVLILTVARFAEIAMSVAGRLKLQLCDCVALPACAVRLALNENDHGPLVPLLDAENDHAYGEPATLNDDDWIE